MEASTLLFKSPPIPFIVNCGKGTFMPGESHNNRRRIGVFDLLVVYQGTIHIGEDDRQFSVGQGETLILRPDLHHYSTKPCNEETLYYWIHFQTAGEWEECREAPAHIDPYGPDGKQAVRDEFTLYSYYLRIPKHGRLPYPASSYNKVNQLLTLDMQSPASARWQQQTIFEDLLKDIHQERAAASEYRGTVKLAEEIATYLRHNYAEPCNNRILHEMFNYHPNHLSRCMKRVFGRTPLEYLLAYRIDKAKQLLLTTSWPIARVAEETGFNHIPYFGRVFRKHEGMPPQQFRNQYVGKDGPH